MAPVAFASNASAPVHPAATFLVRGIFILATRSLFIVRGTVVSGTVRAKQRILAPTGLNADVQSVEANLLDVHGGSSQIALTFHYAKLAQLDQWKKSVAEGTLLSLGDPAR